MSHTKSEILRHVGRIEQLAAIRRYAFEDGKARGMRAFEVVNGTGFDFTVYPDRGLDIGPARYNGKALTWMTRNGPVAPAFYDASAFEWLRTWCGGLVTTCGWLNVGGPCSTPEGEQGLHGRMDHTPAEEVNTRAHWEGEDYILEVTGRIVHSRVFGENLVTSRTIRTRLGWVGVELVDRTENCGPSEMPLMQLYHMNFGWPLIGENTRIEAAEHEVVPRDAEAEKGLAEWNRMPAPTPNFPEQVFFHDLPADASGNCTVKIANPDFGAKVALSFRKAELPYLVQWRMPGDCDYIMGLEPANCRPENRNEAAKSGRLCTIAPGEIVETSIKLEVEV